MRALVCVDASGWEALIRVSARYLDECEVVLAHVLDQRPLRGYELTVRGLLGRRNPSPEAVVALSETTAGELLTEAEALIRQRCPRLDVSSIVLSGLPGEELVRTARERRVEAIFIGRSSPKSGGVVSVSGTVKDWMRNRHGDIDGLYLEDGTAVSFPPHKASEIRTIVDTGTFVEAGGERHPEHLHAYSIAVPSTGASVKAHNVSGRDRLGRTARYVVDHSPCDVLVSHLLSV